VEYFNEEFLQTVGEKIGKVSKIDRTTAYVEWGRFIRMSVEVDLSKPLLSKFKLHGRVWRIQYEGLRLICFKCGKIGHEEETCPLNGQANGDIGDYKRIRHNPTMMVPPLRPKYKEEFGSWMLVKKSPRRKSARSESHCT